MTAPGYLARPSDRAPAADGLPVAVDPSTASFRALALQVRAMGLLDRRPGYYRLKITLTIFAFLAGWVLFVIVGNSWTTLAVAALAGIIFTQLGFISHDAGHNQIFGTRRRNRLLGLTVGNVLIGLSFGWWVHKHNAHHAHPNEMGRDPDIGAGVPSAWSDAPGNGRRPLASWLARWQAPLFFPLMLLRSGGMHVLGIKRLLRQRDHGSAVEASLITLHAYSRRSSRCTWASASPPTTRGCRSSKPQRRPASPAARWSLPEILRAAGSPTSCSAASTTRSSITYFPRCLGPTCDGSRASSGTSA